MNKLGEVNVISGCLSVVGTGEGWGDARGCTGGKAVARVKLLVVLQEKEVETQYDEQCSNMQAVEREKVRIGVGRGKRGKRTK